MERRHLEGPRCGNDAVASTPPNRKPPISEMPQGAFRDEDVSHSVSSVGDILVSETKNKAFGRHMVARRAVSQGFLVRHASHMKQHANRPLFGSEPTAQDAMGPIGIDVLERKM